MPSFDTLQVAKELQTAFTPAQAEALVRAFANSFIEDLATKQDVAGSEARLRKEIKEGKVEMIEWTVGAIAFNLLGTAGLMVTLIKTIPH